MGVRAAVIGTHTEPRPAALARTATAGMMRSDRPHKRSLRRDTMPAIMNVSGSGPMFREPMRHLVSKCFQVELADLLQALRKGSLWRVCSSLCGFSFCDLFVSQKMRFVMSLCA